MHTEDAPHSFLSRIKKARQAFASRVVTELTFSAQQIVLKALTISGLSAGLSSLAFFSITTGSLYESATIFAFGTAYALRKMQSDWQTQCKALEDGLLDAGRTVLRETEETMRELVRDGGRVSEDSIETKTRNDDGHQSCTIQPQGKGSPYQAVHRQQVG